MKKRRIQARLLVALVSLSSGGAALAATEIKGAAILDNPCGKVAVKQMALVHAGKIEDAQKLTTKDAQEQWKAMPEKDRAMMSGMLKEFSVPEAQYISDIKANGVLIVDGAAGELKITKKASDKNGSSTSTMTQKFRINGNECLVSR